MKSVLESLTGSIADFIVAIFSFIFLLIDSVVYAIVGWAYDMFTVIAGARVLDESALRDLADRIYIVIGVIALFIVAYALLQAIIDPDKASKGDTSLGKIIPNIAIAIVGIAIVPTIFNYAYDVQRMILCNNIIPKLLLDNSISYDDNGYYKSENSGAEIATLLFESFFYPKNNDGGYANVSSEEGYIQMLHDTHGDFTGGDLGQAYEDAKKGGWFWTTFSPFIDDIAKGNVGYLIIISTIAGGYCAYVLITYCFDAAIRAVKLAYLEVLAPLPLLLMIVPGQKKIFQNWLKKTLSCFFEIFIRIFAIVFVAFIMRHLPDLIFNMSSMFNNGYGCLTNPGFIMMLLIRALLINALFAFMKQAPKLVSDITGIDSKGFGIGLKGKGILGDALGTLGGVATGAATGALGAGWSSAMNTKGGFKNKVAGFGAGLKYGAANGAKGGGNQFNKMRTQHYKDIVHGKGKAGAFGGQAYIDSLADDTRKSTEKEYTNYKKNKYENDPIYDRNWHRFIQEERTNRENNLNTARRNLANQQRVRDDAENIRNSNAYQRMYNDIVERGNGEKVAEVRQATQNLNQARDRLENLDNELDSFRNSEEYYGQMSRFENDAREEAKAILENQRKNNTLDKSKPLRQQFEELTEQLQNKKVVAELRRNVAMGAASDEAKEFINNIENYNLNRNNALKEIHDAEVKLNDAQTSLNTQINPSEIDSEVMRQMVNVDVSTLANETEDDRRVIEDIQNYQNYVNNRGEIEAAITQAEENVRQAEANVNISQDEYEQIATQRTREFYNNLSAAQIQNMVREYYEEFGRQNGLSAEEIEDRIRKDKRVKQQINDTKSDIEYVQDREAEAELKQYKKTREFAQQAAVYEEALKSLNEPGTGKGTAKAPGDGKAGSSK